MFARFLVLMMIMMVALSYSTAIQAGQKPDDREALSGLKSAKVIFDVRIDDQEKLIFNLNLFNETLEGLSAKGIRTEMIVAFRGPVVKLLSSAKLDKETVNLFRELKMKGVRFEACGVAMRVFKADPTTLIPEIKLVANVFNSLIGYQNKGHAMIVIN